MKLFNLLLLVVVCVISTAAQQLKIPETVLKSQRQKYPLNKVLQWQQESDQYVAAMEIIEVKYWSAYKEDGSWVSTESIIETSELPEEISSFLSTNFSDQKITQASKINYADGTMKFKTVLNSTSLMFDAMGRFLGRGNVLPK